MPIVREDTGGGDGSASSRKLVRVMLNLRVRLDLVTPDFITEVLFRYFVELQWFRPLLPSLIR